MIEKNFSVNNRISTLHTIIFVTQKLWLFIKVLIGENKLNLLNLIDWTKLKQEPYTMFQAIKMLKGK